MSMYLELTQLTFTELCRCGKSWKSYDARSDKRGVLDLHGERI